MRQSLESAEGADIVTIRPHPASPTFQQTTAMLGRPRFAVVESCPQCDGLLTPEHTHFRCATCGWRDSSCD
jgi:hypothetical protein